MDKQQWKAINCFCKEVDLTPPQLIRVLKDLRVVGRTATLERLDEYVEEPGYQPMMEFLRRSY